MGFLTGIIKFLVFIFNFLCLLVGIAFIVIGSICLSSTMQVNEVTNGNFSIGPIMVLAVGVFICIISFLGCCGVWKKSRCMLITYAAVLAVLLIIQLGVAIYGFMQLQDQTQFKTEYKNNIRKSLSDSKDDEYMKDAWDSIQKSLECCGVDGPGDWDTDKIPVPLSCCVSGATSCDSKSAYKIGCFTKIYDSVTSATKIVAWVALGIAIVELLGIVFAIILVVTM